MSSPNYNKKGICTNSTFLRAKLNLNELDCLTVCQNYDGCNYVTFRHDNTNLCLLFQTCSELDIDSCPTCLTGPFAQSHVRAQFSGEQLRGVMSIRRVLKFKKSLAFHTRCQSVSHSQNIS